MQIPKLGIFFRGILMGVAEIVPGISGGTVAFITGIYAKLVSSIAVSYTHLTLPTTPYV